MCKIRSFGGALVAAAALVSSLSAAQAATIQGVQSGTAISTASGTVRVPIASVDPARAFLIFGTRHDDNRPTGSMVRGRIAAADTLEFARETFLADTTTIEIRWNVVEYADGVSVQRGEVAQTSTVVDVALPTPVAAVDQAFVTWSKTPAEGNAGFAGPQPILAELTSPSNLQIRAGGASADHLIWWQVVEFTNPGDINVQKGSITTMGTDLATVTATLSPPMDPAKTFVLVGYNVTAGGADIGKRMLRAVLTNSTTVTIDRAVIGDPVSEIVWQAIELNDGSFVQGGSEYLASGTASKTVGIASVDMSRSVPFASVQAAAGQSLGRSPYVLDDVLGVGSATMSLVSSTQLALRRTSTVEGTDIGWFVVEFGALNADLAVTTAVDDALPKEGDTVTYTVEVANAGPDGATGVAVTDVLPTGVTWVSDVPSQGTYSSGTGVWNVGTIGQGAAATLSITVSVDPGTEGSTIGNTATVTALDQNDANATNDSDTVEITVEGSLPDELQITTNLAADQRPNWSPDDSTIAFDSDRVGNLDLWTVTTAGATEAQLTFDILRDQHPDYSPDGTQIVFSSRMGGGPNADIWLMPVGGGGATLLSADAGSDDRFPSFSPDGTMVAFTRFDDIWVVPATGGTAVQLTTDPGLDGHPTWSPDGTMIAFQSNRSGNNDVWIVPAAGGTAVQLTTDPANDAAPDWAPSSSIVFHSNRAGNNDIWMIPADGGTAVQITSGPENDVQPDWSRDAAKLAFSRDGDIWTYTFPTDLEVVVSVDVPAPAEGDPIQYTVELTNHGPKSASGVSVADPLPSGVTYAAHATSAGTYDEGAGVWDIGNVPFGATETLTITVTVDGGTAGTTISNSAAVSASDQLDRDPANDVASVDVTVSVSTDADPLASAPRAFRLDAARPNPSRNEATIRFDVPVKGTARLDVFDVSGRHVATLVDGSIEPGRHARTWDGRDAAGRRVAAGVYFVRLEAGTFTGLKKMVRLR